MILSPSKASLWDNSLGKKWKIFVIVFNKNKIILCIVLLSANHLINICFNLEISFQKIFFIHFFLFSLSVFSIFLKRRVTKLKKHTPLHLLTINFFRICVCIIFLLPTILKYSKSDNIYIYNFFIIYFVYLFFEMNILLKNQDKVNV